MAAYDIYQPLTKDDPAEAVVVVDGFSWLALASPTVWSIRHGLWELVVLNTAFSMLLATVFSPTIGSVAFIGWHAAFCILAGDIHAKLMEWRGHQLVGYVADATGDEDAFTQWAYTQAAS